VKRISREGEMLNMRHGKEAVKIFEGLNPARNNIMTAIKDRDAPQNWDPQKRDILKPING
jgi:hypothetical protein